jgi:hypothetical protein
VPNAPTPQEFEDEVRGVARALWPSAASDGAAIVNRREVDGLFSTDEVVHMVEASMSRRVDKAHNVGPKLRDHLKRHRSGRGKFAKAWFVTYYDPTGHQREELKKYDPAIEVVSFEEFRKRLIDAPEYLRLRDRAQWGSAADPVSDSRTTLPNYVPLGISVIADQPRKGLRQEVGTSQSESSGHVTVDGLIERIRNGDRIALVGDYGAGKSMTVREVHRRLAQLYWKKESVAFPITLNLRKHYGQVNPEEALRRHADEIGFDKPSQLVKAWLAGYVHLLLDGFDEMSAPGWSGSLEHLRENRRAATTLLRAFLESTPARSGVLLAGRRYYFDSLDELGLALFGRQPHTVLTLNDFTIEQAQTFIRLYQHWNYALPAWLPARPLLLGHLAVEHILEKLRDEDVLMLPPAAGWDWLLDRIADREAFIQEGMDGRAVREILERLATIARATPQGVGPLTSFDIADAFTYVRRQRPSDAELTLLQRLPGIGGEESAEEGTRRFIDLDLASTAQAGDVVNYLNNPYDDLLTRLARQWTSGMESLGVEVAAHQLGEDLIEGNLRAALSRALQAGLDVLAADIVGVAVARGVSLASKTGSQGYAISGVVIPSLDLSEGGPDLSAVRFFQCIVSELSVEGDPDPERLPSFSQSSFETVMGRLGQSDMPPGTFSDCEFGEFPEAADRNAAILNATALPRGTRVTMTVLRKLYLQRGRGRRDSALPRGMDQKDRELVQPVLKLLQAEGLVVGTRLGTSLVWLPDRSAGPRVRAFLKSPRTSNDPLVAGSRALDSRSR